MILCDIEIAGWRCFVETTEIGPFTEGLNVIFAPNGTGKSTMFEAMSRGLLDSHRVSGRDVENLRPWGRELSPRVRVRFIHSGNEYRMEKKFLDNASSLLERKEGDRFCPIAENDRADRFVQSILTKNPPARGMSRMRNWGLAQALWVPQDHLVMDELSDDIIADIRTVLNAELSGRDGGHTERKIEELYHTFFTPGGRLRTGRDAPEIVLLRQQLEKMKEKELRDRENLRQFEETAQRVTERKALAVQKSAFVQQVAEELTKARIQAENFRLWQSEYDKKLEQSKALEARYNERKGQMEMLAKTQSSIAVLEKESAHIAEKLPELDKEYEKARIRLKKAKDGLEEINGLQRKLEEAEIKAADAGRCAVLAEKRDRIDFVLRKAGRIQDAVAKTTEERRRWIAPGPDEIREIRKIIKERDEARLRIDHSGVTLEMIPEKDAVLDVSIGDPTGRIEMLSGREVRIDGIPMIEAEVPGFGKFRIVGPVAESEIKKMRSDLAQITEKLAALTKPYRTDHIEQLESLADKARELDAHIRRMMGERQSVLEGKTVDEWEKEHRNICRKLGEITERYPEWQKEPPKADALQTELEKMRTGYASAMRDRRIEWEQAREALSVIDLRKKALEQHAAMLERQLSETRNRMAELIRKNGKPEERERELNRILLEWNAAKAECNEMEKQRKAYDDDPVAVVEEREAAWEKARKEAMTASADENRERGRLDHLASLGPYSELAETEERIADLETKIAAKQLRMDAIRLLYDTLKACRQKAAAEIAKPVEKAATDLFLRIAGNRFENIGLDGKFRPLTVAPAGVDNTVAIGNLSGGEKEQLYLATRLALAGVVAMKERHLVVLDDALTATDSDRMDRIIHELEETAKKLQIIILTCHPERYQTISRASFLDLEATMRNTKINKDHS